MRTKGLAVAGLVALFGSGLVCPVQAEKGDMQVRFGVVYSTPNDDRTDGAVKTELDDAFGIQAGFEYMVTDSIGVEPAVTSTNHDIEITEPGFPNLDFGDVDLVTLSASVNFHFLPERKLDVFVGPTVGYAFWGDIGDKTFPVEYSTDDEFLYGASGGLDVPFGESRWGFAAALRLLFAELPVKGGQDIGVDPIQLEAGVFYSF